MLLAAAHAAAWHQARPATRAHLTPPAIAPPAQPAPASRSRARSSLGALPTPASQQQPWAPCGMAIRWGRGPGGAAAQGVLPPRPSLTSPVDAPPRQPHRLPGTDQRRSIAPADGGVSPPAGGSPVAASPPSDRSCSLLLLTALPCPAVACAGRAAVRLPRCVGRIVPGRRMMCWPCCCPWSGSAPCAHPPLLAACPTCALAGAASALVFSCEWNCVWVHDGRVTAIARQHPAHFADRRVAAVSSSCHAAPPPCLADPLPLARPPRPAQALARHMARPRAAWALPAWV